MDGSLAAAKKVVLYFAFLSVVAAQFGLAVESIGGWSAVCDSRPIVSGRHPLHLVHSSLGSQTFRERWTTSCYDPAFQAGYPKTPVFDGGCRPAELVLFINSFFRSDAENVYEGEVKAYKLGLLAVCLIVPFAFAFSARGAGAGGSGTVLAATLGTILWWSPACHTMYVAGEIDLMLAGLCGVAFGGSLSTYHRNPGPKSWLIGAALAAIGWYSHPVVWLAFTPLVAGFYLSVGPRHGLAWHLGLFGGGIAGLIPNLWWLIDWGRFWWLRRPPAELLTSLPSPEEVAAASGWSQLLDWNVTGWPLLISGVIGAAFMLQIKARTPAWLFIATMGCSILMARLGQVWPALAIVRTERAAMLAASIAVVPSAFALGSWWERARIGILLTCAFALFPIILVYTSFTVPYLPITRMPLPLGLTQDQEELVQGFKDHTTPTARILLEDGVIRGGWNWTAMLPRLTDRTFLGGLEMEACIEPLACALRERGVMSRSYTELADADLRAFADRYNIGWVACRSEEAVTRWRALAGTIEVGRFRDDDEIVLLKLDRPHRFITRGTGTWDHADHHQIVLKNLVPDQHGFVSVSLHYQPGMRISPPSVVLEPEKDPYDPTPLIRLRMAGPVTRVTIVWQNP